MNLATKSPPSTSTRRRVAEAADYATLAAQADGSDEEALLSLGVDRSEVAVVGQGQNIEESISCALILKRIGVPWVIAKAETDIHGEILIKVGADRIVYPEQEAGDQVAHSLEIRHLVAYMNLTQTCGVARIEAPPLCCRPDGCSDRNNQTGREHHPHPAERTSLTKASKRRKVA